MKPKLLSNSNYAAKVKKLSDPVTHPNAERLEGFNIDGNTVWYGKGLLKKEDIVIFFPVECQINPSILSYLNLFAEKALNTDKEKAGYFDSKGRVKALRLRGEPSEGFIIPVTTFYNALFGEDIANHPSKYPEVNTIFDTIEDTWICKKYIPVAAKNSGTGEKREKVGLSEIVIENQFRFHYDTEKLQNNLDEINPEDWIVITKKLHGTSAVFANVLTRKNLNLREKIARMFGVKVPTEEYTRMYSSRSIIKRVEGKYHTEKQGYYNDDIWGLCYEAIKGNIEPGITLYGEIVGYLPGGKMVQKNYDYGYKEPHKSETFKTLIDNSNINLTETQKYNLDCIYGVNYGFHVYRITYTNSYGNVLEYTWEQLKNYCKKYNLQHVPEMFSAIAMAYTRGMEDGSDIDQWRKEFFEGLRKDVCFEMEQLDSMCANDVPAEGICIRRETRNIKVFKLKCFRFLEKESAELDSAEIDLETQENNNESNTA